MLGDEKKIKDMVAEVLYIEDKFDLTTNGTKNLMLFLIYNELKKINDRVQE